MNLGRSGDSRGPLLKIIVPASDMFFLCASVKFMLSGGGSMFLHMEQHRGSVLEGDQRFFVALKIVHAGT